VTKFLWITTDVMLNSITGLMVSVNLPKNCVIMKALVVKDIATVVAGVGNDKFFSYYCRT